MDASQDLKQYADRLEFACRSQMKRIAELEAEVARLQAEGGAHSVLKAIYLNGDLPESLRAKAATAALPHETPKLMPERAPLELKAQEPEESLQDLCARRRARQDALEAGLPWPPECEVSVANGNGSDGGDGSDD